MKPVISIITILSFFIITVGYGQALNDKKDKTVITNHKIKTKIKIKHKPATSETEAGICFPVEKDRVYSLYTYIIDLRRTKIIHTYKPLFRKYNYAFSGYVWEGILQNIIRGCPDKDIAQNTFVKAQDNMVFFSITKYRAISKFISFICPILGDSRTLERYIKNADRNYINNF